MCVLDLPNQEQFGLRGGIYSAVCVQPTAAAGGGQVVQREVHTRQQPQRLLAAHRQVAPPLPRSALSLNCFSSSRHGHIFSLHSKCIIIPQTGSSHYDPGSISGSQVHHQDATLFVTLEWQEKSKA